MTPPVETATRRPVLVLIGPLPLPVHGVTISTQRLLGSDLKKRFRIIHLDTSDHRTVDNIGAFDWMNIYLGLRSYAQLAVICLRERPDLVYVPISQSVIGFLRDAVYLWMPRLLGRSAVVVHLRGGFFGSFYDACPAWMKQVVNLSMRRVARVIVLGACLKPIFHRWFDDSKLDIAPNGSDLIRIDSQAKLAHLHDSPRTIGFMSSLMRSKGLMVLLHALDQVFRDTPCPLRVEIAGEWWNQEPELKPEVEAYLADKPWADCVHWCGLLSGADKVAFFERTQIFTLPSYYPFEGHPNVIVEAMAGSCAVVATDHVAIPETVIDGETGLIVSKESSADLAQALLVLLQDEACLHRMMAASYRRYQAEYTEAISTQRVEQALLRALKTR